MLEKLENQMEISKNKTYQELFKQQDDNPSIGIILCPEKDDLEVEYALKTSNKPIGVAEYSLTQELPEQLKGKIPTKEEIKRMLTMYNKS